MGDPFLERADKTDVDAVEKAACNGIRSPAYKDDITDLGLSVFIIPFPLSKSREFWVCPSCLTDCKGAVPWLISVFPADL
jgi:hypothetical protein